MTDQPDSLVNDGSSDLPTGYRWATEHEMDRPDAIVVPRTFDSTGKPYTEDEADLAVPLDNQPDTETAPERLPLARPSTAFERPPGNVYVLPDDTDLDPDGPAKFYADLTGGSSDHQPVDAIARLAREAGMETMRIDGDGEAR